MGNALDIPGVLRQLRLRTALTQEKLAAGLGVAFPTLNRWENGRARPSPLALKQIEHCLRDLGPDGQDLLRAFCDALVRPRSPHALRAGDRGPGLEPRAR